MRKINYIPIVIFTLVAITACITTSQKLDPAIYYRKDMCFESGDTEFCGVGVLPYQEKYEIKVKSYGKLNFFSINTCHREDTTENPDDGIFRINGNTKIKFVPLIEKEGDCPMYVSAYNKNAKHAWGFIAFEHPNYKLKATVLCNGKIKNYNGVSTCSSREGLKQKIVFGSKVDISKGIAGPSQRNKPCSLITSKDGKSFEFKMPNRECRYAFIDRETKQLHTLYTIGYEDIIIRE